MPHDRLSRYHRQSHAVYDCRYHVVWVTKYRFQIIDQRIEVALKWAIKHVCDSQGIEILEGSVLPEHVHLYLQIPPKLSIAEVLQWIKGKSATQLFKRFPELEKRYWGRHLWARGYFVSTVGITDTIIRQYIQNQRQAELNEFDQTWKS